MSAVHTLSNFVPGLDEVIEEIDADVANRNVTIQYKDDGVNVGVKGGIENIDFTGAGVTATNPAAGLLVIDVPGGSGSIAFTDLTDVPPDYSGEGGKAVAVNFGETGLEFVDFPSSGLTQAQVMTRSLGC